VRLWGIDPKIMCRQHLLGEHKELHMMAGSIALGKSIRGYVTTGLIDTRLIALRHEALATEMAQRGYKHRSPLRYNDKLSLGYIDLEHNLLDLITRCPSCAGRYHRSQL
jgi:hypothetical protein